jgi:hypothetical protein
MGRARRFSAWTGWAEFDLKEVPPGDRRLQRAKVCDSLRNSRMKELA